MPTQPTNLLSGILCLLLALAPAGPLRALPQTTVPSATAAVLPQGGAAAQQAPPPVAPANPLPQPIPGAPHVFSPDETLVVYEVKHATPDDLKDILGKLIPSILVLDGPRPKFINKVFEGERLGQELSGPAAVVTPGGPPNGSGQPIPEVKDEYVRILLLSGPKADVARALAALTQIDLPSPQILIEAKIIEVSIDKERALGISWNFAPGGTTATFTLKPGLAPSGTTTTPSTGTTGTGATTSAATASKDTAFFGRLVNSDISFTAALDAAVQNNYARLLANPRIMTLDNKRAEIFIGQEISYLLAQIASQNGATTVPGKVRVGIELNVTARANPDDTISLRVHPEVGRLDQITTATTGVALPQVSRRAVDTQVRLKNGETLVIGGLIGDEQTRYIRKIPLLGDIPVLGYLFKHEETRRTKTEIIMFIKASIIKD